jgi:uncharacterized damage-inducible protein DinB
LEEAWLEALRYNRWANLRLLDTCGELKRSQLELTAPGTYGSIAATWLHLIGAERRYLWRLNGAVGRFSQHRRFPGIDVLSRQAAASGDGLIEAARRARRGQSVIGTSRRGAFEVAKAILLVQAIHHGNDHRTHVCTVLGHHHLPYPDMDVWTYGEATGKYLDLPRKA